MNKKLKMIIVIASAIALITTILSIVFLQNLKDPVGHIYSETAPSKEGNYWH